MRSGELRRGRAQRHTVPRAHALDDARQPQHRLRRGQILIARTLIAPVARMPLLNTPPRKMLIFFSSISGKNGQRVLFEQTVAAGQQEAVESALRAKSASISH